MATLYVRYADGESIDILADDADEVAHIFAAVTGSDEPAELVSDEAVADLLRAIFGPVEPTPEPEPEPEYEPQNASGTPAGFYEGLLY